MVTLDRIADLVRGTYFTGRSKLSVQLTEASVGRKYRTRNGDVIEIVEWDNSPIYPAMSTGRDWYTRGGAYHKDARLHPRDLIEEVGTTLKTQANPWDSLRATGKPPIKPGAWNTYPGNDYQCKCEVRLADVEIVNRVAVMSVPQGRFLPCELRQLADFCTELADQLEGK
jgi:hypothetical protein